MSGPDRETLPNVVGACLLLLPAAAAPSATLAAASHGAVAADSRRLSMLLVMHVVHRQSHMLPPCQVDRCIALCRAVFNVASFYPAQLDGQGPSAACSGQPLNASLIPQV